MYRGFCVKSENKNSNFSSLAGKGPARTAGYNHRAQSNKVVFCPPEKILKRARNESVLRNRTFFFCGETCGGINSFKIYCCDD